MKRNIYLCEPSINFECSKSGCFKNGGECKCTMNEEFALRYEDGKPVVYDKLEVNKND